MPVLEFAMMAMTTAGGATLSLSSKLDGSRKALASSPRCGTNSLLEKQHGWESFLWNLAVPHGRLSSARAGQVRELWGVIERFNLPVEPPHAAVTEEGGVSMTWDRGRHHFEIEVLPEGTYDWFYMDRDSKVRASEESIPLGIYSPELFSRLRDTVGETWRS